MSLSLSGLTYFVRTFGCQMNEHDSERVSGLLESVGAKKAGSIEAADIPVFMTCSVREKADTHLYALVQALKSAPTPRSGLRTVCIGGCIAQRDDEMLKKHVPIVNVVFGTQAIPNLPNLIVSSRETPTSLLVDTSEPNTAFTSELPSRRASATQAWLPIMSGCNNFCTYCIVPYVRGRERSRDLASITYEARALVADGVKEITLLGQNVNSYQGKDGEGFSDVLEAVAKTGIERIRFTSSHPKDLTQKIVDVMAAYPSIMPHLHLAAQSGSDAVLSSMNRRYTKARFLEVVEMVRESIPDISLTTDLIVGFPGESEKDFLETLDLVKRAQFSSAFTFIYSRRPGTKAASLDLGYTDEELHSRFNRLVELVSAQSFAFNQRFFSQETEVLVEGRSKKDNTLYTGHNPENIAVHFSADEGEDLNGKLVNVRIEQARTWYVTGKQI